jgi:Transposase, Mutator family
VSASSAIRWRTLERRQGDATAKAVGSDRRSEHMKRHGDAIRSLVDETPDLTLGRSGQRSPGRAFRRATAHCSACFDVIRSRAKKDRARGRAGSPDIVRRREAWFEGQVDLDPDCQDGLFDELKKAPAERVLNAEIDDHLVGEAAEGRRNPRNGYSHQKVIPETSKLDIWVPRDREGTFDPKLIAR